MSTLIGGYKPILFFFFNDTATTEIYTLSLHDALPICIAVYPAQHLSSAEEATLVDHTIRIGRALGARGLVNVQYVIHRDADRKSTRLNSSHSQISYAVFCLKKKYCYTTKAWIVSQSYL